MFLQGVQPISLYACAGNQWKISTVKILTEHSSTSTRSPSIWRPSFCVVTDTGDNPSDPIFFLLLVAYLIHSVEHRAWDKFAFNYTNHLVPHIYWHSDVYRWYNQECNWFILWRIWAHLTPTTFFATRKFQLLRN